MEEYTVITKERVYRSEPEEIVEEQYEKMRVLGIDEDSDYICHFFDSAFFNEFTELTNINTAIEYLAVKDGFDMVQYRNGNYGFVAYYDNQVNGFEIIG